MATIPYSIFPLADGQRMRYRLTYPDEPHRPTVQLSSLLATTAAVWDDGVVNALHQSNFRVLSYDHPGHGGSSVAAALGTNTFEAMADAVYALLTCVLVSNDGNPPKLHAWIGCSLGSVTGVVFATRCPGVFRNLVVCDTVSSSPVNAGIEDNFTPRVIAARKSGTLEDTLAGTRERWLGKAWLGAHPDKEAWLRALMSETTLDGFETCIAALPSLAFDLGRLAPNVASSVERVLLVVGEKDQALAEKMRFGFVTAGREVATVAASKSCVQFHVLADAGHSSFLDAFEAWCAVVIPFLG